LLPNYDVWSIKIKTAKEWTNKSSEIEFVDSAPQQDNTWDWGIFVMALTQFLLRKLMRKKLREIDLVDINFDEIIDQERITNFRKDMKELVLEYKKDEEERE
jgi:Ulp1 family protease